MKRWLQILLIVLAFALLVPLAAQAITYLWVTTVTVDVTEGVKDVVTYSDPACTANWTKQGIVFEGNHAWVETVYVKNNGSAEITVGMMAEGDTSFGFVMFSPSGKFTLTPDQVQAVEVSLYCMPDAAVKRYVFSIIPYE